MGSLKRRFMWRISIPLGLAIVVTGMIPLAYLLAEYKNWILSGESSMKGDLKLSMSQISHALSESLYFKYEHIYNSLFLIYSWTRTISRYRQSATYNLPMSNAYDVEDAISPSLSPSIPNWAESMWYLNPQEREYNNLERGARDQVGVGVTQDIFFRPLLNGGNSTYDYLRQVFTIFDHGMLYAYPTTYWQLLHQPQTNCPKDLPPDHFQAQCIQEYLLLLHSQNYTQRIFPPYYQNPTWKSRGCTRMDPTFNIIIGCIEFDLIQLFGEFKYENTSDNYFYVYDVDSLQLIFHSQSVKYINESLAEVEFGGRNMGTENISESSSGIPSDLLSMLRSNQPEIGEFKRNGGHFYIGIQGIWTMSEYDIYKDEGPPAEQLLRVAYVVSTRGIEAGSLSLIDSVKSGLYWQIVVFIILILLLVAGVIWICIYVISLIVEPIHDLSIILKRMIKSQTNLSVKDIYKEYCYELNILYLSFDKMLEIIKYANDEYFGGNDVEAIIHYACAMKLFRELGNLRGVGVCANNIGNIHLNANRYSEAIDSYIEAVNISAEARQLLLPKPLSQGTEISPHLEEERSTIMEGGSSSGELNVKLKIIEDQSGNRLYQLAFAYLTQIQNTSKLINARKAIKIFNELLSVHLRKSEKRGRVLNVLLRLLECYILVKDYEMALSTVNKAQMMINGLEQLNLSKLKQLGVKRPNAFLNSLMEIPMEIAKQRLYCAKGNLSWALGEPKKAAQCYTLCLENGEITDESARKIALSYLMEIFKRWCPEAKNGIKEIESERSKYRYQKRSMVFILESSKHMKGSKLEKGIECIRKVFSEYINNNDEVAFVVFNSIVKEIYAFTEKGKNTQMLIRRMSSHHIQIASGCILYKAIDHALNMFNRKHDLEKGKKQRRSEWIFLVTIGRDSHSAIMMRDLRNKLKVSKVVLVVMRMTNEGEIIKRMEDLCSTSIEGYCFDPRHKYGIETAFHTLDYSNPKPFLNVENLKQNLLLIILDRNLYIYIYI